MAWMDLAARWQAEPGLKVAVLTAAALLVSVPAGVFAARYLERHAPNPRSKPGRQGPGSTGE